MSVVSVLSNRSFLGLLSANTVLASAFPIQLILGGLAGMMLAPTEAIATVPSAVQTLAGLLAAAPMSLLMGRLGRRAGFVLGAVLTVLGALAAVQALFVGSFVLLCAGHFLMGAGWAGFQYFRFAAGEVVDAEWRPVSISLMLTSGLVAAIVGPQLFIVTQDSLAPIPFAGAYAVTAIVAMIGVIPLAIVRMPRPVITPRPVGVSRFAALAALKRQPVRRAVGIAAVSQGVMVFFMIPTPIAMIACGFTADLASDVVRWHIVAMFAPSFFTGFLIKRFGAQAISSCGLITIVVAAAAAAQGITAAHFYCALIVLGVGWNFSFISATAMLDAALAPSEKAAVQGANDTAIALVSTVCAFAAGFVVAGLGWTFLAIISGAIAFLAIILLLLDRPQPVRAELP